MEIKAYETKYPDRISVDSPTLNIGRKPSKLQHAVCYSHPMQSLNRCHYIMDVFNWATNLCEEYGNGLEFVTEYKIDGVAICVTYNNGKLKNAHTRGDGHYGTGVTEHILKVNGLKHEISFNGDLVLRGEAYITKTDFDHVNSQRIKSRLKPIKSQVGAVSGAFALLDPEEFGKRNISVTFFGIEKISEAKGTPKTQEELHCFFRQIGIPTFGIVRKCSTPGEIVLELEHAPEEKIQAHGVVIKVNDFAMQDKIGYRSFCPSWSIAYMWKGPTSVTTVKEITMIRNTQSPTVAVKVSPVVVSGIEVKNIRLSMREFAILQIKEGDAVRVYLKSGCYPGIAEAIR